MDSNDKREILDQTADNREIKAAAKWAEISLLILSALRAFG